MKKIKESMVMIVLLVIIFLLLMTTKNYASTDEVCLFVSSENSGNPLTYMATVYVKNTFEKLGYNNVSGTSDGYRVTNNKQDVINYIRSSGKNYGFYEYAHGKAGAFSMDSGSSSATITSSDISGNWHLVILNSCYSLENSSLADAFHTTGYSNRASLGWYGYIGTDASAEFWRNFYPLAGTMNLRDAALGAADQCQLSTPIRIYGDKSWYGWAW